MIFVTRAQQTAVTAALFALIATAPALADSTPGDKLAERLRALATDARVLPSDFNGADARGAAPNAEDDAEDDAEDADLAATDPTDPTLDPAVLGPDPEDDTNTLVKPKDTLEYAFGSYGRVGVGTDINGGQADQVNVVRRGPRLVETNYVELDGYFIANPTDDLQVRTVATMALAGELFHSSGDFDSDLALRNLFAEASYDKYRVWIGSRMYRGDDIYLLDYWPLDDVNTVGAGAGYYDGPFEIAVHAGANRLNNRFQFQQIDVPDPEFGAETIDLLDRQRYIGTLRSQYIFLQRPDGTAAKIKTYFEVAGLPSGQRRLQDQSVEDLPSDFGWTAGFQLGAWGFAERASFGNLFVRYSQGLTAHDELGIPFGFNAEKRTFPSSSELVIGWSGNYETGPMGVLTGGYVRRFADADGNENDRDDGWEYVADFRPYYAVTDYIVTAVDLSYQRSFPRGVSPTMLMSTEPAVFQVAPMLIFAPLGIGSYERPQFRFMYRGAHLNDAALDLYPLEDSRRDDSFVHFFGFQVEWWFNSASLIR